jgi:hypothetical protein
MYITIVHVYKSEEKPNVYTIITKMTSVTSRSSPTLLQTNNNHLFNYNNTNLSDESFVSNMLTM